MPQEEKPRVPQLIAFDLDYTLWDFWIDTHVVGPLKCDGSTVKDKYGTAIAFYPDVPQILNQILAFEETTIAVCSRTGASALAREALSLIPVPLTNSDRDGKDGSVIPAAGIFNIMEIYPGSKIAHFKQLHQKTGISYTEMLFYDDETRNREVASLGVTFVFVRNGLDTKTFEKGLNEWRKKRATDE